MRQPQIEWEETGFQESARYDEPDPNGCWRHIMSWTTYRSLSAGFKRMVDAGECHVCYGTGQKECDAGYHGFYLDCCPQCGGTGKAEYFIRYPKPQALLGQD